MGVDREAEVALLGALLIDAELIKASPPVLREPGVLSVVGQQLYKAIVSCNDRHGTVDALLVSAEVKNGDREKIDTLIAEALTDCPMSKNARRYADVLERNAKRGELVNLVASLTEAVREEDGPARIREHLDVIGEHVGESASRTIEPLDLKQVMDEEAEPIPWAVPGWLAEGDTLVVGGEPGTGKSVFAMDMALALATGGEFLSMKITKQLPVLYIDEEMPPALARRRLRMFMRGRELEPSDVALSYYNNNQLNLDHAESRLVLRNVLDACRPKFVVLDSLIRFHDRNENDAKEISNFLEMLKGLQSEYEFGWIILHHLSKPGKDKSKELGHRLRGSSDIRAACDQIYGLEGDPSTPMRTLTHDKNRWGEPARPLTMMYAENEDHTEATLSGKVRSDDAASVIIDALLSEDVEEDGLERPTLVDFLEAKGFKSAERLATQTLGRLTAQGTLRKAREGRRTRYWHKKHAPQQQLPEG